MSESTSTETLPTAPQPGPVSSWLTEQGLDHIVLEKDNLGVEIIGVEPNLLIGITSALKENGYDFNEEEEEDDDDDW